MRRMISCLVSQEAKVFATDDPGIAPRYVLSQGAHFAYEFHLDRRVFCDNFAINKAPFGAKYHHDQVAIDFFDDCAGTAEKLIAFVLRSNCDNWDNWCKYNKELLELLTPKAKGLYDKTASKAWDIYDKTRERAENLYDKQIDFDAAWTQKWKTLEAASALYDKTRGEAWVKLFADPENRIPIWRQ